MDICDLHILIEMPSKSVINNPLWYIHEKEVISWANPEWSIADRISTLTKAHKEELGIISKFSAHSEFLLQGCYMPGGLSPNLLAVHKSKNVCYFEHIFRETSDPWGHPPTSPMRRGFRTVGPI